MYIFIAIHCQLSWPQRSRNGAPNGALWRGPKGLSWKILQTCSQRVAAQHLRSLWSDMKTPRSWGVKRELIIKIVYIYICIYCIYIYIYICTYIYIYIWLVVSITLKNISQLGWLLPTYRKIKNVPNHQPDIYDMCIHTHIYIYTL